MHIHITPHHVPLTSALRSFTLNKIGSLGEVVGPDIAAHVVLRLDPKATRDRRFLARVRFARRGADLFVSGTDATLHSAIDQMVGKITGRPGKCQVSQNTGNARLARARS